MRIEKSIHSFDGTMLYVSSTGKGAPVVLCDGVGCDGFVWRYLAPALAKKYQVVHWHYRGHGKSGVPRDPAAYRMMSLRRDLLAVLDAFKLPQAALLGHSMGVQVVLDFALAHPKRVSALLAICGSYGQPLNSFHGNRLLAALLPHLHRATTRWPGLAKRAWRRAMRSALTHQYAMMFEVAGSRLRRREMAPYFKHLEQMDLDAFLWTLSAAQEQTVEPRLTEITQPTLVVVGEHDSFTPAWLGRRMQRLIPGAQLLTIKGGTHAAPLEFPDLINSNVPRFLGMHLSEAKRREAKKRAPPHARSSVLSISSPRADG
jgi:pimeloyl-ACP methyl ester carboxylesterase